MLVTVVCLGALFAVVVAFLLSGRGPAGWSRFNFVSEAWRGDRLAAEWELSDRLWAQQRSLLKDVATGKMTLARALPAFRTILEERKIAPQVLAAFPGKTDEERFARALINQVEIELKEDHSRIAVVRRLEEEMREWFSGMPALMPVAGNADAGPRIWGQPIGLLGGHRALAP